MFRKVIENSDKLRSAFQSMGLRGAMKSIYYSKRHTNRFDSLLFGPNVVANISPEASVSINGRLQIGMNNPGASHPSRGPTVLTCLSGSSISHTGDHAAIVGPEYIIHVEGKLSIGDSRINSNARIVCGDEVRIGDGVVISWNVTILDDNRHELILDDERQQRSKPIHIGDNVWIGHDSSIEKGVTIGNNSIVASNSVVTNDIPPSTIVAGVPAKPIFTGNINWGP